MSKPLELPDGVRKSHFSIVITRTFRQAWAILAAIVISLLRTFLEESLDGASTAEVMGISGGLLLMLLAILAFNWLRWRKTFIYFDSGELVIDRRTMNSSKASVRMSSIAAVNLTRGIWEKLFGTYRLQLDINSSATAGTTDFELVFKREIALEMKGLLTERPEAEFEMPSSSGAREEKAAFPALICSFSFGKVVRHCLLSIPLWSILAVTGVAVGAYFEIAQAGQEGGRFPLVLLLVIAPLLYQGISPFFRYYRFTMSKAGDSLLISYGFLTTREFTLPLEKMNAIVIKQPFLARLCGLCYGELINVGLGDSMENLSPVFCLMLPKKEVNEIVRRIAAEYVKEEPPKPAPKAGFLPVLVEWEFWGVTLCMIAAFVGYWWVGALILAFFLLCAYFNHKTKELGLYEDKVSISSGVFQKRNITIDYGKLQNISRKCNPISKRVNLEKGSVAILASASYRSNGIGYFPSGDYDMLEKKMLEQ